MKLLNWAMSKLVSPGAYALWHSMGSKEEWMQDECHLVHRKTGVRLDCDAGFMSKKHSWISRWVIVLIFGAFCFDAGDTNDSFLTLRDRCLISGRGYRLFWKLLREKNYNHRKKFLKEKMDRNIRVFKAFTINE